jgi:hypothetical protein
MTILICICITITAISGFYQADSITEIDVTLEDHEQDIKYISLTNNDLLTIQLNIPSSDLDISVMEGLNYLENADWRSVGTNFTKTIAFTKSGTYRIILENPGAISGGDAIHITGRYTVTDGEANQAEVLLGGEITDEIPYDPLTGIVALLSLGAPMSLIVVYYLWKRYSLKNRYKAPNYKIARQVEIAGYPSYELYEEGLRRGAKSYIQYQITERFQVKDYRIAKAIAGGNFPNYKIYKKASDAGFTHVNQWKEKLHHDHVLKSLMAKSNRIHREDFIAAMGFSNNKLFMDWIMSLPGDSPIKLTGDIIEFRKIPRDKKDGVGQPRVGNNALGLSAEKSTNEDTLENLSTNQRQMITDLVEGKALPQSQLLSAFKTSEINIISRIKDYLPLDGYIIRISDLYRLVKPSPSCLLCARGTDDIPYFQCKTCGKYICQGHYSDMKQIGYPVCPECGGEFQILPLKCNGCGVTFLDINNLSNSESCQFCNYTLSSSSVNELKASSLNRKQIADLESMKKYSQEKMDRN